MESQNKDISDIPNSEDIEQTFDKIGSKLLKANKEDLISLELICKQMLSAIKKINK